MLISSKIGFLFIFAKIHILLRIAKLGWEERGRKAILKVGKVRKRGNFYMLYCVKEVKLLVVNY